MAIIKCPECGHQVSEKAPTCPSCGVRIAGQIVRCTDCGEIYFNDQPMCPSCHRPTSLASQPATVAAQPGVAPANTAKVQQTAAPSTDEEPKEAPKKKSLAPLIVSFIFALIVCGVCYYFYNKANVEKETEEYESAMKSNDPMVLQSYLDRYKDADPAHRDSIQAHLMMIQQYDEDWTNAVVSGTRSALEEYIKKNPDSPHKADALNKIDSLDYIAADKDKSVDALRKYIAEHPDGRFVDVVTEAINKLLATQIQPEEAQMVKGLFKRFFQSVNSRNEDGLLATVAEPMLSLLGKPNALKSDVVTFLNKLYKENVANLNWHIIDDYKIDKMPMSNDTFEYNVEFTAELTKDLKDGTQDKKRYRISGSIDTEGKISNFKMTQLAE